MNILLGRFLTRARLAPLAAFPMFLLLSSPGGAAQTLAGNADRGKAAFAGNGCNSCHGDQAEGAMGPALAGTARSFAEFTGQVRKPKGSMPAFDKTSLADSKVADIYAFVKSLPQLPATDSTAASAATSRASSTPAADSAAPFAPTGPGNAEHGKTIFASYGCYQCHGLQGQGAAQTGAARIGPPPIPVSVFANYIRRPSGNMPPYAAKVVSDSDVSDIYAFLQSIKAPPAGKDIPLLNQ